MKAITYTEYGTPEVLTYCDVEKPVPSADEVLVDVHAASVDYSDWAFLRGKPFIVRLMGAGISKPKNQILGADIAGRVESVGRNVKTLRPGDAVLGDISENGRGGFAEYVCAGEDSLVPKPANITFAQAAATPQDCFSFVNKFLRIFCFFLLSHPRFHLRVLSGILR